MGSDPAHAPDAPGPEERVPGGPSPWRVALRWGERLLWVGVLVFAAIRLGPQIGAWTGIGPSLGSVPDFELTLLDGRTLGPADLEGRVAVVNFWATWCPPCRIEIPALQALREDFSEDELAIVGISTDVAGAAEVRAFMAERGVTYDLAMADGGIRRAFGGVSALPTTFILDREGVVRHRVLGFFAPPAMKSAVRRLLSESTTE